MGQTASKETGCRKTLVTDLALYCAKSARSESKIISDAEWYFTASTVFSDFFHCYVPTVKVFCKRMSLDVSYRSAITIRTSALPNLKHIKTVHFFSGKSLEVSCDFNSLIPTICSSDYIKFVKKHNSVTISVVIEVKKKFGAVKQKEQENISIHKIGVKYERFFSPAAAYDCTLVIEGKHVMVKKKFLSARSNFFNAMFESNFKEANENEIELGGVAYEEFIELLSVLYRVQPIIAENVECILKLADYFDFPHMMNNCLKFLLLDEKIPVEKKLLMAQNYRLEDLMSQCIKEFSCLADVKKLLSDVPLFEQKTCQLLLSSVMQLEH